MSRNSMQQQLALFDIISPVEDMVTKREDQWFDRKSFRIDARHLADHMIGFSNADGGRIVIGIHKGQVEGINSNSAQVNNLLQAALDYSSPPVRHEVHYVSCVNAQRQPDRLLLFDIEASENVHRNRSGECFLRVGDENRRLRATQERELSFDRGETIFDKSLAPDVTRDDLDQEGIAAYIEKLCAIYKIDNPDTTRLLRSREIIRLLPGGESVTQAGWLLLGQIPPVWSYIRYLRYDGIVAETGVRSNLIEDVRLEGTIPSLIEQAKELLSEEIKPIIRLGQSGRFERVPALPEFAWLEAVVNAVTHRSYSMQGDGVRVTQYSDRLEVMSPGRLPGLVRVQNIREMRLARNPHIARVLAEMTDYVRELNEGVKRMFEEMQHFGLREPQYRASESSVTVTLYKRPGEERSVETEEVQRQVTWLRKRRGVTADSLFAHLREAHRISTHQAALILKVTDKTARSDLERLENVGLVVRTRNSPTDPSSVWVTTSHTFWQ